MLRFSREAMRSSMLTKLQNDQNVLHFAVKPLVHHHLSLLSMIVKILLKSKHSKANSPSYGADLPDVFVKPLIASGNVIESVWKKQLKSSKL